MKERKRIRTQAEDVDRWDVREDITLVVSGSRARVRWWM